jgi:hypothetical protein
MATQKSKQSQYAILTVVSMAENSFGLQDHDYPFTCEKLSITLTNKAIPINKSIIAYNRNGRLTNPEINTWIQENNLNKGEKPIKLVFRLERRLNNFHYKLYMFQANYLKNI